MKRSELKSNPAKRQAFIDRGRAASGLARTGIPAREASANLKRNARVGLRVGQRKRRPSLPKATRARVYARSDGLCVCGCGRKCTHVHHVLRVEKSEWSHLVLVERVMVGMYHDCHWSHEFAPNWRLPYEKLPPVVIDYVRRLGPAAEAELIRYHPRVAEPSGTGPTG